MSLYSQKQTAIHIIDDLRLLGAQVLDHPHRDETFDTWQRLEGSLSPEHQNRILIAWNKHLIDANTSEEIIHATESVIDELQG
jgi:hypothetical protein